MARQIFVNLPVKNLNKSIEFFTQLGFSFNPDFTDENATCMIISDNIFAMLLVEKFFQEFTKKALCDTKISTEVLTCISLDSKEELEKMVANAIAAGGTAPRPAQDHGFMYGHGFEDLDGHIWELIHMLPGQIPA